MISQEISGRLDHVLEQNLIRLHSTLTRIRAGGRDADSGICWAIYIQHDHARNDEFSACMACAHYLMRHWPKYSGNPRYPVPATHPEGRSSYAFHDAAEDGAMWEGEYGKLRLELLDWLIQVIHLYLEEH